MIVDVGYASRPTAAATAQWAAQPGDQTTRDFIGRDLFDRQVGPGDRRNAAGVAFAVVVTDDRPKGITVDDPPKRRVAGRELPSGRTALDRCVGEFICTEVRATPYSFYL